MRMSGLSRREGSGTRLWGQRSLTGEVRVPLTVKVGVGAREGRSEKRQRTKEFCFVSMLVSWIG